MDIILCDDCNKYHDEEWEYCPYHNNCYKFEHKVCDRCSNCINLINETPEFIKITDNICRSCKNKKKSIEEDYEMGGEFYCELEDKFTDYEHKYCETCERCMSEFDIHCKDCNKCHHSIQNIYCPICNYCFDHNHKICQECGEQCLSLSGKKNSNTTNCYNCIAKLDKKTKNKIQFYKQEDLKQEYSKQNIMCLNCNLPLNRVLISKGKKICYNCEKIMSELINNDEEEKEEPKIRCSECRHDLQKIDDNTYGCVNYYCVNRYNQYKSCISCKKNVLSASNDNTIKYCSETCYNKYNISYNQLNSLHDGNCAYCNKLVKYVLQDGKSKYCNIECYNRYHNL